MEGLNLLVEDPAWKTTARRELDQILRFEPRCQRALYLHGLISIYEADFQRATEELGRALELGPNPFVQKALERARAGAG